METLGTRIRKSSKELGDQGARLLSNTREAGKDFATFIHEEARDWSAYLRDRAQSRGPLRGLFSTTKAAHEEASAEGQGPDEPAGGDAEVVEIVEMDSEEGSEDELDEETVK